MKEYEIAFQNLKNFQIQYYSLIHDKSEIDRMMINSFNKGNLILSLVKAKQRTRKDKNKCLNFFLNLPEVIISNLEIFYINF